MTLPGRVDHLTDFHYVLDDGFQVSRRVYCQSQNIRLSKVHLHLQVLNVLFKIGRDRPSLVPPGRLHLYSHYDNREQLEDPLLKEVTFLMIPLNILK